MTGVVNASFATPPFLPPGFSQASEAAQRTKKAVEKLSKQCLEMMYGEKADDALKQLDARGKHKNLKIIGLRDPKVASNPANKKYVDYAKKIELADKNAVAYKQEAIIFGKGMTRDEDDILAHEYQHIYYDKDDSELVSILFDKGADIQMDVSGVFASVNMLKWQEQGCPKIPTKSPK